MSGEGAGCDDGARQAATRRPEAIALIQQSISQLVRKVESRALAELVAGRAGVTLGGPYYRALTRIVRDGPITASAMARDLSIDASTVSRHISALERQGLVQRIQDSDDGRVWLLTATEEGKRSFATMFGRWLETLDGTVHDWSDEDVAGFAAALAELVERLSGIVDASADTKVRRA